MTENATGTALAALNRQAPTDDEIQAIRSKGRAVAAYQEEVRTIRTTLEGLEWGSGSSVVKGSEMSPKLRHVLAEFCFITRANPLMHVDILGGKPYLNSQYWEDRINSDPYFHHYEQREISPSTEKALRERAAKHRELAAKLQGEEAAKRLAVALDLEEEADDVAMARSTWSAPEWPTSVVETTIVRFMNNTPIEKIRSGEIVEFDRYLIRVAECNWAGNRPKVTKERRNGGGSYSYDPDPIGNEEPAKTARTRSLRRAAKKAFPAWMTQYEEQIRKAEEVVEGEWEVIREDQRQERAALPASTGPQAATTGSGEPSAANAEGAREMPVEDATEPAGKGNTSAGEPVELATAREKFRLGCVAIGAQEHLVIADVLEGRQPETVEDYRQLTAHVNAQADADDEEQEGLGLS